MFIKNDTYKVIIENSIIETVDFIVLNEQNKILLWLRNNEPLKWIYYIPWWRRYKNEKIMDSLKRKFYEELWISINKDKIIFLWIYDDIYPNSMFWGISSHYAPITYVYKLNKNEEKNIKKDMQHDDLRFFDLDDDSIYRAVKLRITDMKNQKII